MKIALVYDVIYPYVKGGAERRFYEIGKRLARNNEVHFFGMKFWKGEDVVLKENVYLHGVCKSQKLYTGEKRRRSIKEAVYFSLKLFRPLLKEDFDLVDCSAFPYFSLFTCKLVCVLKGKKIIGTWHEVWGKDYWIEYLGSKGIFGYLTEKLSALIPDRIISVSRNTTNKLKNDLNVKKKIYTVPNGVDFNKIQKIKPLKEKSDIIFAGRLLEHKNIGLLMKSIKLVKEKFPVKCFIIGEGPEREKLKNLTKKLQLEKNIRFLDFQKDQDDVYSLMKSSKVFVLPSTREGFGIVAIEANACGLPVITIEHKDNAAKDSVENGKNGFVCKLSEKEIADKIMKVIEGKNPRKKMKQACINSAKKYDWEKIVDEVEEIYRE